jgi:hypothetical protein
MFTLMGYKYMIETMLNGIIVAFPNLFPRESKRYLGDESKEQAI